MGFEAAVFKLVMRARASYSSPINPSVIDVHVKRDMTLKKVPYIYHGLKYLVYSRSTPDPQPFYGVVLQCFGFSVGYAWSRAM